MSSLHIIGEMKAQVSFFERSQKVSNSTKYTQVLRKVEEAVRSASANQETQAGTEEIKMLVEFRKSVAKFITQNAALVQEILPKINAFDRSPGTISADRKGEALTFTATGKASRAITKENFTKFVSHIARYDTGFRLVANVEPSDAKPTQGGRK